MKNPRCEIQNSPEFPNAVEVETANARYRLVYGDHFIDQDHEILRGADAIVVEIAAGNSEEQARDDYYMNLHFIPQFSNVLRHAKEEGVPIYFVDTEHAFELPYITKVVIEGLMACGLLNYFVRGKNLNKILTRITNHKEGEVTSRRHFLRNTLRAMGLVGVAHFGIEKSLCMTTEERSKILADIFEEEELSQETIVKLDFKKNEISFLGMTD